MNNDLYEEIVAAKNKNKVSLLNIILKFKPLISKYKFLLNYEDAEQDLILALIEVVYKLPVDKMGKDAEGKIIKYISTSLKTKYILLSKKKQLLNYQIEYSDEIENTGGSNFSERIDAKLFLERAFEILTPLQKDILVLKYWRDNSDIEISGILGISRQAVNRIKIRSFCKIKSLG